MQDGGAVSFTAPAWLPFVLLNYEGASKMLLFSLQFSVLQPLLYVLFFCKCCFNVYQWVFVSSFCALNQYFNV